MQNKIFERLNANEGGKKKEHERRRRRCSEEEGGVRLKPILQQRLQCVYPMKPSNAVPTSSVTTSECTITFYKGRMKCQN